MARTQPVHFSMYYKIEFCTNIRGHHVYQTGWTPEIEERLICLKKTIVVMRWSMISMLLAYIRELISQMKNQSLLDTSP